MRIHVFQHVSFEDIGFLREWATERGHSITYTRFFEENAVMPVTFECEMLVIMGGPMSVRDESSLPWLNQEKLLIRRAIDEGIYVLGICLGAQLIAEVLGGQVTKNPYREIGWFPIAWEETALKLPLLQGFPDSQTVLHWHGETFSLPPGAQLLASSDACVNQAFLWKHHVLALQFHLEVGPADLSRMVQECADEFSSAPFVQSPEKVLDPPISFDSLRATFFQLLDHWLAP